MAEELHRELESGLSVDDEKDGRKKAQEQEKRSRGDWRSPKASRVLVA